MAGKVKELQYFLYSQAFADGLRATIAILTPALIGMYTDHFTLGLTVSLGAMCVSLTDAPGPFINKKNGMLFCCGFIFISTLLTTLFAQNIYALGVFIGFITFFFSMFNVYGARAGGIGNAAILIMILTMDRALDIREAIPHALLVTGGGLFYTTFSLLLYKLRPYRLPQRSLGDCIREMANYLSIKADFYRPSTDLNSDYSAMIAQQVVVHDKQDATRELLFKSRVIVSESTEEGRRLVFTFVETVDLFESITATYYDYGKLREQFAATGILEKLADALKQMATELDNIGISIQSNTVFKSAFDYDAMIIGLNKEINELEGKGIHTQVLKRILVNIRNLLDQFNSVTLYFRRDVKVKPKVTDHSKFISHQSLNPKILFDNLSLRSSVFRHALRVCIACIIGFIVAKSIAYGHHSYWILLTIAFILKPAFSLTKQRNIQRIIGTLAGGAIGVFILYAIPGRTSEFILMVVFMLATYSFMRINYLAMVISTTPYVLILFNLLGVGFIDLAGERLLDTVIACAIAFSASYFLFPTWEAEQIKEHMKNMLQANAKYLLCAYNGLIGKPLTIIDYKLARKSVYVASANLSAAFQRMLSEPKHTKSNEKYLHSFVVLNHLMFSNIATVISALQLKQTALTISDAQLVQVKRSMTRLNESITEIGGEQVSQTVYEPIKLQHQEIENKFLNEQIQLIDKLSADIEKATLKLL